MPAFERNREDSVYRIAGGLAAGFRRYGVVFLQLGSERVGDLAAVKAAVLNKNLVGARAGHDDAGEVDAGHVALQGLGIADGEAVGAFKTDAQLSRKVEVGVVAGHGEDEVVGEGLAALGGLER